MRQKSYEQALTALAEMCAKSEKCRDDVVKKATAWGLSFDDASKIADYLEKENFINEVRYAQFYARDKYRFSKWGKRKIEYMLRAKRIGSDTISEALGEIPDDDYEDILLNVLRNKMRSLKYTDYYDAKSKLFRHCASKGYEADVVGEFVERVLNEFNVER